MGIKQRWTADELLHLEELIGEEKEIKGDLLQEKLDKSLTKENLGLNSSIELKLKEMLEEEGDTVYI